jgi:serine/threonine protein kinase
MSLTAGEKLGSYEILAEIGRGGMGVVYKARDSRLGRLVAIKVLPLASLESPQRKARFIQEAKAASALNHPNIITIHDIANHNGSDYIVMEYVAGSTLDALIPSAGMPLQQLLSIAIQIVEGLSKAHSAHIIHRDLKPANLMVPVDGPVKILDFGLAKLTEPDPISVDDSTLTAPLRSREEGVIAGTPAYMSPEQAEAKNVDARSDLFSLGAVLYEMASGQRAFRGDSMVSTLAAILKEEPRALREVAPETPQLERIIFRCLRKQPDQRWQSACDLKTALVDLREKTAFIQRPAFGHPARSVLLWLVVGVLVMAGTSLWLWFGRTPTEAPRLVSLTTYAGEEQFPAFSRGEGR